MFDWLKKKGENAKVWACVDILKRDLEMYEPLYRAKVLAMANVHRLQSSAMMPEFSDIIRNTYDYPRQQLMRLYDEIEYVRNTSKIQQSQMRANIKKMGGDIQDDIKEIHKVTNASLEVWMTLIACGIKPDVRDKVRDIWVLLWNSRHLLPQAIDQLVLLFNQGTQLMGGQPANAMDKDEWLKICDFFPEQFSKSIF